jgi:hypothetical protein
MMWMKRGKRLLPSLLAIWVSGGRRFKSAHPDFILQIEQSDHLSGPKG